MQEERLMSRLSDDSATLSDHRIQEWFVQQRTFQEREAREQAQADALKTLVPDAQAPPPVITVTRQIGSSGDAVARAVAEKLSKNWQVWDNEIIEAIARSAGV